KVGYVVDPANEYPRNYTGHIRATLKDGSVVEMRQPHMRGGARDPLSDAEIIAKFRANCAYGGFAKARAEALLAALESLATGGAVDLGKART
ncbi:MAG: MmgE/PrpD family protein, partial [Beijerinckiaceae bacterium]